MLLPKINLKKLPRSEIEIEAELEAEVFEEYFSRALRKIGENMEIPGFRKGKVPEKVLSAQISEARILEEMAGIALSEYYPKILEENKIDAIGRPNITLTKLARRNPLGFKIKTAVLPEVGLPGYKKIAGKIISETAEQRKNTEVTEKEIEETIMDIRRSRALKRNVVEETKKHTDGAGKESQDTAEEKRQATEPELPELNDGFVRALGPFTNVADFREKLKENIKLEKENQARERTRVKIAEQIIDESKIELPEILIGAELDKILYRMESDIAAMGLKFEDYMKHLNKTRDDLRREFRIDAEKKAKLGLILNKIAEIEKIAADPGEVQNETAKILEHYKDADPERARMHAENVLLNEEVFRFLERQI